MLEVETLRSRLFFPEKRCGAQVCLCDVRLRQRMYIYNGEHCCLTGLNKMICFIYLSILDQNSL